MSYERDLSISRSTSSMRNLLGAEVLVIDKDQKVQDGLVQLLSHANLNVTCAGGPDEGFEHLEKRFFSVVIVDLDTPIPSGGLTTIAAVKSKSPTSMVVMLTPRRSFEDAVKAIRAGAIDIVLKAPASVPYLKERVMEAASRSVDTREVTTIFSDAREVHGEFLKLFMDAERRAQDCVERLAGRDPDQVAEIDEIRLLVVAKESTLAQTLNKGAPRGYVFESALTGGQALDRCGSNEFHYVLIGSDLPDLPSSMVVRSVKAQSPESVVMTFIGPRPGGKIEIVETTKTTTIIDNFTDPTQLLDRLGELAEAYRAKSHERRYTQAFRERHYDFLRRFIELRSKIERALGSLQSE